MVARRSGTGRIASLHAGHPRSRRIRAAAALRKQEQGDAAKSILALSVRCVQREVKCSLDFRPEIGFPAAQLHWPGRPGLPVSVQR